MNRSSSHQRLSRKRSCTSIQVIVAALVSIAVALLITAFHLTQQLAHRTPPRALQSPNTIYNSQDSSPLVTSQSNKSPYAPWPKLAYDPAATPGVLRANGAYAANRIYCMVPFVWRKDFYDISKYATIRCCCTTPNSQSDLFHQSWKRGEGDATRSTSSPTASSTWRGGSLETSSLAISRPTGHTGIIPLAPSRITWFLSTWLELGMAVRTIKRENPKSGECWMPRSFVYLGSRRSPQWSNNPTAGIYGKKCGGLGSTWLITIKIVLNGFARSTSEFCFPDSLCSLQYDQFLLTNTAFSDTFFFPENLQYYVQVRLDQWCHSLRISKNCTETWNLVSYSFSYPQDFKGWNAKTQHHYFGHHLYHRNIIAGPCACWSHKTMMAIAEVYRNMPKGYEGNERGRCEDRAGATEEVSTAKCLKNELGITPEEAIDNDHRDFIMLDPYENHLGWNRTAQGEWWFWKVSSFVHTPTWCHHQKKDSLITKSSILHLAKGKEKERGQLEECCAHRPIAFHKYKFPGQHRQLEAQFYGPEENSDIKKMKNIEKIYIDKVRKAMGIKN